MTQADRIGLASLAHFRTSDRVKRSEGLRYFPDMALCPVVGYSCRRSGRSPALPYPPHEWHEYIMRLDQPFAKGTFLLCKTGDISTLR
jgi:hypothetical protein